MQEAIALTWSTLTARLKNLRAGAVCAGLGLFLLIIAALWLRSGRVLAGLPLLMLVGIAFFHRDAYLVYRWGDRILASWGASDLCMGILVKTFRDHPGPLKATLKGMIGQLPANPDFLLPPPAAIRAERILFWAQASLHRLRFERSAALNLAVSAIPVLAWEAFRRDSRLLPAALAPLALVPPARALLARMELARLRARLRALGKEAGEAEDLPSRLEALDGGRLPAGLKAAWLRAVARD